MGGKCKSMYRLALLSRRLVESGPRGLRRDYRLGLTGMGPLGRVPFAAAFVITASSEWVWRRGAVDICRKGTFEFPPPWGMRLPASPISRPWSASRRPATGGAI